MNRWLELAQHFDKENLRHIPAKLMSDNGISMVYINPKWVYKRSIPFMIENEMFFLKLLGQTCYVPQAMRYDKYTITLEYHKSEPVTNIPQFEYHCEQFLKFMKEFGIKHGDLTEQNILVRHNIPIVIDWAEARLATDPRPMKRPEGDRYWMNETMKRILDGKDT